MVEREETLTLLDDLLTESAHGKGVVAAISGSIAMGKTSLLNAMMARAERDGGLVLGAVGSRDENRRSYGVLGQLLHAVEPDRLTGDHLPGLRSGAGPDLDPADVHGRLLAVARELHGLIIELAADRRLLIAVDDIQHADIASLWCLRHVAERLTSAPVTLAFTRGALIDERPPPILHDLLYWPSVRRIHLEPLSPDGIADLPSARPSCVHSDRLIAEIHSLSAGNPLLARALIEEHRFCADYAEPGARPRAAGAAPGELPTGHTFHQAVLACMHRLGSGAVRLARSIALLDGSASTLLLSRLSGIDAELVERFVRALTTIGVLHRTRFRHRAIQQSILQEIPLGEGAALRHWTARLLHEDGAPPHTVAPLLLDAGPLREDWVPAVLRGGARQALTDNDVARALRYLELAGECCADEARRMSVRAEFAGVQWQLRPATSDQHFLALKGPILDGTLTGADALQAVRGMLFGLDVDDALEAIDHLNVQDGEDAVLEAELRGTRLFLATEFPGALDRTARPLPAAAVSVTAPAEVRAAHALALVLERGADEYAVALAEQVLQSGRIRPSWVVKAFPSALMALVYADRLEAASDWCERLMAEVEEHDVPAWRAAAEALTAVVALRRGRLTDAVEHGEAAFAALVEHKWNIAGAMALATLIEAHTAQGDHQAAARYAALEAPPALFLSRAGLHYLYARGRHHLATANNYMALSDFLECGKLMRHWDIDTPALAPWRLGAAEAWLELGDRPQAAQLIDEQLTRTDPALARSRGMVLRGLAAVRAPAKRPTILQDALQLLESNGSWYEAACVLADLSDAYQSLGEKAKARTIARRAWRIAKSCHAEAMCQTLLPTYSPGAAGTGEPGGGADTDYTTFARLSDSERRVAVLAAQGYTNREIADKLFITVSTVEQHLTRVYRKMDIRNREQLLTRIHLDSSSKAVS
ncbi:LuxR family transcriptional regulator [Actinomadura sp. KC06]|nr:LuxR family transcriptional regulator [Actinomadura sp. KC06]